MPSVRIVARTPRPQALAGAGGRVHIEGRVRNNAPARDGRGSARQAYRRDCAARAVRTGKPLPRAAANTCGYSLGVQVGPVCNSHVGAAQEMWAKMRRSVEVRKRLSESSHERLIQKDRPVREFQFTGVARTHACPLARAYKPNHSPPSPHRTPAARVHALPSPDASLPHGSGSSRE